MRRVMVLGIVSALMGAGAATAQVPSEPPDRLREDYSAEASWMIPTPKDGRARWLMIAAERSVDRRNSVDSTSGFVIQGKCRIGKNFTTCFGTGPWVELDEGFEMSPDMSTAHIEIRHKSKRYTAHVEADGPLGPYLASEACFSLSEDGEPEDEGSGEGIGAYRTGAPTGTFDGRKLTPETGDAFGFMMSGAMLTSCEGWWPRVWVNEDGTAGAVWRFPTAR